MSTPQIVLAVDARADLLELERYIAEHDGEMRAELILGRINETIRTLPFMPGLGALGLILHAAPAPSPLRHGLSSTRRFPVSTASE